MNTGDEWTIPAEPYETMIGQGRRYATEEAMAADLWRWHDEAQAEKMENQRLLERLEFIGKVAGLLHTEVAAIRAMISSITAPASAATPEDADLHDPEHWGEPEQTPLA